MGYMCKGVPGPQAKEEGSVFSSWDHVLKREADGTWLSLGAILRSDCYPRHLHPCCILSTYSVLGVAQGQSTIGITVTPLDRSCDSLQRSKWRLTEMRQLTLTLQMGGKLGPGREGELPGLQEDLRSRGLGFPVCRN